MFGMSWQVFALEEKRDLLATDLFRARAAHVAVGVDPRLRARLRRGGIGADENRAARVVAREIGDQSGVARHRRRAFAVDGEVDERRARGGALALIPEFFQLAVDAPDLDGETGGKCGGGVRHGGKQG